MSIIDSHSFSIHVATHIGVERAIILSHIRYWVHRNRANERNEHDGRYWSYNSIRAFCEIFPYISEKTMRRILLSLKNDGYIDTGNFNENRYDRTLWYTTTEKTALLFHDPLGQSGHMDTDKVADMILPNGQINFTEQENGSSQKGEPIPDINTDINTDIINNTPLSSKDDIPPRENIQKKSFEDRKDEFKKSLGQYSTLNGLGKYDPEMLREFFEYWTEPSKNGKKMRWEDQKFFDIQRRLKTWSNNNFNKDISGYKAKLNRQEANRRSREEGAREAAAYLTGQVTCDSGTSNSENYDPVYNSIFGA